MMLQNKKTRVVQRKDDDCGKKQKNDDARTIRENDVEVNLLNLPMDPGLRHPISYHIGYNCQCGECCWSLI